MKTAMGLAVLLLASGLGAAPAPAGTPVLRDAPAAAPARGDARAETPAKSDARAEIDRVVSDYVGLYAGPTLDRWKALFHPAMIAAFPADDGSITVRTLDEFHQRQKNYFATGRRISERLENVRVDEGRKIARVSADFVFVDEGEERRGRLGLHLVRGNEGWKIVAVLFSYDAP
jgi:hypothetical protein